MQRREFLQKLKNFGVIASTAAVTATVTTVNKTNQVAGQSLQAIGGRIKHIENRLDAIDARQKKVMKYLLAVTVLSTGLDISIFLS